MARRRKAALDVSPPARAPVMSVEEWAAARGWWPQVAAAGAESGRPNGDYWRFAATKAFKRWTDGHPSTEAEFLAAVDEMLGLRHG
jgi:hypothetical protein